MEPSRDPKLFVERALENRLRISPEQAVEAESFEQMFKAAYSTIREIDTDGFEPAAIFVPTPSRRRSD